MRSRKLFLFFVVLVLTLSAYLPAEFSRSISPLAHAQSGQNRQTIENKKKQVPQDADEIIEGKKGETIKIDASLINIDITVRDKKTGGIYTGLKPGNFAVYEDG